MKTTQMIVDNRYRTAAAAITAAKFDETAVVVRCLWCMSRAAASILVHKFTKLSLIVFSIVDNTGRRYDSCIVTNKLSLPSNP